MFGWSLKEIRIMKRECVFQPALEHEREYRECLGGMQVAWRFDNYFLEHRGSEFGEIGWVHIPKNTQCQVKEFDIIFL